jgi:hypothetical protein
MKLPVKIIVLDFDVEQANVIPFTYVWVASGWLKYISMMLPAPPQHKKMDDTGCVMSID